MAEPMMQHEAEASAESPGRRQLDPWRAAINWYLGVWLFGTLAATVSLGLPFIVVAFTICGPDGLTE